MINPREVITMRIPFGSKFTSLRRIAHMYVCVNSQSYNYSFFKIQSQKPLDYQKKLTKLLLNRKDYPNLINDSFIDLAKKFNVEQVKIANSLKTNLVLKNKHYDMLTKIKADNIFLPPEELVKINWKITLM